MKYYFWIPLWFAVFMEGKPSPITSDIFHAETTVGGRKVITVNAASYYNFDTVINNGWELVVERLASDSLSAIYTPTITVTK